MHTQASWAAMLQTLRPSTLAGLVHDLGWALEEKTVLKSEWAFLVKMSLNELISNVGVAEARKLIELEGE